ncbi:MAG: CPBP family intramembrane metalloprotease, partial [Saprospiraceae bacterium]|nr:CPBP family intramembrane metalloprotease [Saprospiraceae bacterium]
WRYILVLVAVFFGYGVGQIPLTLAINRSFHADDSLTNKALESFTENPNFELFGINSNMGFALLLMLFVGAFTAFFFIFKPIHQREFKTLITPSSRIKWDKILFGFFLWLGLAMLMELIAYFLYQGQYTIQFKLNTFIPLLLLSILLLPVQTSLEELVFRGYLLQGVGTKKLKELLALIIAILATIGLTPILKDAFTSVINDPESFSITGMLALVCAIILIFLIYNLVTLLIRKTPLNDNAFLNSNFKVVPLIITSILFGMMHMSNPEIAEFGTGIMQVYYISAGLALGIMTIMDDGLELALGVHAATNFVGAVFVGYDGAAIQTDSILKTSDLNPSLMAYGFIAISIIFLLIVKQKYKWESFNKLFAKIDQSQNVV